MGKKSFQKLLFALVMLTLLALYAHANWMTRTWVISGLPYSQISAVDDRPLGGSSKAQLIRTDKYTQLQCQIETTYQWPFCELALEFTPNASGVDLSQFDSIRLSIRTKGPEANQQVRIFLRNFDPAYSAKSNDGTLKPHEIVYTPNSVAETVEFKLSQFTVASWWTNEHPTSIENLGPQLNHVTTLGIVTAGTVQAGPHEITLYNAELKGRYISQANFLLGIIFIWLTAIVLFLIIEWRNSTQELLQSDLLRAQLFRSNAELESRVQERTLALATSNARLMESLETLESARQELVESEKNAALGTLVSGIAHELNTPIGNALLVGTTLQYLTEQLEKSVESGITKRALHNFISDAQRSTKILTENLDRASTLTHSFKQLSADQHSGQRREFLLHEMMEETVHAMAPRLRHTQHKLELEIDPHIKMNTYPGPLSQVIINFINNALLHAFENRDNGKMLIQAHMLNEREVEINFIDDGVGIPHNVLRRVFEPFFTTKLGKGGSGLGMHIVYNIVTQVLGGKLRSNRT